MILLILISLLNTPENNLIVTDGSVTIACSKIIYDNNVLNCFDDNNNYLITFTGEFTVTATNNYIIKINYNSGVYKATDIVVKDFINCNLLSKECLVIEFNQIKTLEFIQE